MPIMLSPDDAYNRQLAANVHPADWSNPIPSGKYNLVVVGAGTAGLVCAAGAAGLGAKVALIERHLMGGDCLNVGCVPSKALLSAARTAANARKASAKGTIIDGSIRVDFASVMERMRRLRAEISPNDSVPRFQGLGVDVFLGSAVFTGHQTISVGGATLNYSKAVIATGGRPVLPDIPGLAEVGCLTNETVFSLTTLPPRLAVIGGGPIGCELAQVFARFGSSVTLIERGGSILPREEAAARDLVSTALAKDGVTIKTLRTVTGARLSSTGKTLTLQGTIGEEEIDVDEILVGVGRRPNVEGLGLEAAGVRYDEHGVVVDDFLRTSNRRIYAAGDICSRFKFTHAADAMARIVLRNALFLGRSRASSLLIPWCTYTDPEVAHVGIYPRDGDSVRSFTQRFGEVDRAILEDEREGFVTIHTDTRSDRILGATIVASHAGDLISEITTAMNAGIGLGRLASVIHPYPTIADAIRRCGDAYNKIRLTPRVAWAFKKWLEWSRSR